MKIEKIIWWFLLIIACIPFCILLLGGLDGYINGTINLSGDEIYGLTAFKETIIVCSLFMSPYLICSIVLIIIAIKKIKSISKIKKNN